MYTALNAKLEDEIIGKLKERTKFWAVYTFLFSFVYLAVYMRLGCSLVLRASEDVRYSAHWLHLSSTNRPPISLRCWKIGPNCSTSLMAVCLGPLASVYNVMLSTTPSIHCESFVICGAQGKWSDQRNSMGSFDSWFKWLSRTWTTYTCIYAMLVLICWVGLSSFWLFSRFWSRLHS